MSEINVTGIIGGTIAIGRYVVNDYVITITETEGDYGYTMTITKGTQTQTVTLYGLTSEQYDAMLRYLEQAQAAAQSAAASSGTALDAATRAETAAGQITGMTAEAETLAPGSPATASFLNGVLSLGIPAGETGATGAQGDPGPAGETGNGIVSIIKTGTQDNVDTYTITYTNGTTSTFTVTNGTDGAVLSVAGKTGAVTLDAGDVEYDDTDTYAAGTVGAGIADLKSDLNDITEKSINIASKNWTLNYATYSISGDVITVTTTRESDYNGIYQDFDVSDASYVTISYSAKTGVGAVVRYGSVSGGSVTWVGIVSDTVRIIDVSSINTLRVFLYAAWNVSQPSGTVSTFTKFQIEKGFVQTKYESPYPIAVDRNARDVLESVTEKTINLFNFDNIVWENDGATAQWLADGKTIRVTSTVAGTYKSVRGVMDVRGINSIYVQTDAAMCSINQQTTTPRIRIGKLNGDGSFASWLGDTQFGKAIDVSSCDYVRIGLYAIFGVSSAIGTYVDYTNIMISEGNVRKQYIDGGFSAIDKVSKSPYNIPDYYFENDYLDNKIARINSLCEGCMGNGDAFIFMTDQHWRLNAQNSPALVKYIREHTNINRMFMGGDLCNGGSDLEFFAANKAYENAFDGEIDYAVGNHEYLHTSLNDNKLSYWLYMQNKGKVYGDYDRHYYYIDNNAQKIRYIVLSAYQYSGSSSSSVIGYEEAQQNWLRDVALATLTSGWTAIIVTHLLYSVVAGSTQDTDSILLPDANCTAIANIIANYDGDGEIACVMQGHTHLDKITEVQTSGIPVVVTTCDKYADGTSDNTDLPRQTRTHATITEQAFDVVILDKTARKLTFVRIGAPALDGVGSAWGAEVQERVVTY